MSTPYDMLTLDPVAMRIVNRVASGSVLTGDLEFQGGLLVQGVLSGHVRVKGRLIVWRGGRVSGRVHVTDDVYLFGSLGDESGGPEDTKLECEGQVYVSRTGLSTGTLLARRLVLYDGAELRGPFKTLKGNQSLPILNDEVS